MGFLLRLPFVRLLHERQLLFPAAVVIVVAGVLIQGTLKRKPPATVPGESVAEVGVQPIVPRPVIRADLEKTPLTYQSDYWNQLAQVASENLILIGPSRTAAVLIGPRLALTTASVAREVIAERRREALASEAAEGNSALVPPAEIPQDLADVSRRGEAPDAEGQVPRLRAWDEEIGLALFDVTGPDDDRAFTLSDPRSLPSGAYLGAVSLDGGGTATIAPGYLVTTLGGSGKQPGGADAARPVTGWPRQWTDSAAGDDPGDLVVAMALPPTLSVAAVVDLDGEMVGFTYETPRGPRVVTTTTMLSLVDALQPGTVCRSIEVSQLTDDVRGRLGVGSGVLIEYLVAEAFAPEPSLRPGDVLLEWGNTPLESVEQFMQLYDAQAPGSLVRYRVLRDQRRVTGGTVMPARDCAPVRSDTIRLPRFGLAVEWMSASASREYVKGTDNAEDSREGWRVLAVVPDGPADTAGVDEGDWLVSVDGRATDSRRDRTVLEEASISDDLLLLSLRRGVRAKLAAVPPLDTRPGPDGVSVDTDAEDSE